MTSEMFLKEKGKMVVDVKSCNEVIEDLRSKTAALYLFETRLKNGEIECDDKINEYKFYNIFNKFKKYMSLKPIDVNEKRPLAETYLYLLNVKWLMIDDLNEIGLSIIRNNNGR